MISILPIQLRLFYANGRWHDGVYAVLGTDPIVGTTLVIPLPGTTECYAELYWEEGSWILKNHSKYQRVFINEIAINGTQSHRVNIDDRIEIGNYRFLIEPRDSAFLNSPSQRQTLATVALTSVVRPIEDQSMVDDLFDLIPQIPITSAITFPQQGNARERQKTLNNQPISTEMQRLQEAYFKALIDPNARLEARFSAVEVQEQFIPPNEDSMAIDIEELLCGDADIHTLMHRLNPMGSTSILPNPEHQDVLILFAGNAPTWQGQSLPKLAQHDHHLMSLNSEYRLTGTQDSQHEDTCHPTQPTGRTT